MWGSPSSIKLFFGEETRAGMRCSGWALYRAASAGWVLLGYYLYLDVCLNIFVAFNNCIIDANLLEFVLLSNWNVSSVNLKALCKKCLSYLNVVYRTKDLTCWAYLCSYSYLYALQFGCKSLSIVTEFSLLISTNLLRMAATLVQILFWEGAKNNVYLCCVSLN